MKTILTLLFCLYISISVFGKTYTVSGFVPNFNENDYIEIQTRLDCYNCGGDVHSIHQVDSDGKFEFDINVNERHIGKNLIIYSKFIKNIKNYEALSIDRPLNLESYGELPQRYQGTKVKLGKKRNIVVKNLKLTEYKVVTLSLSKLDLKNFPKPNDWEIGVRTYNNDINYSSSIPANALFPETKSIKIMLPLDIWEIRLAEDSAFKEIIGVINLNLNEVRTDYEITK